MLNDSFKDKQDQRNIRYQWFRCREEWSDIYLCRAGINSVIFEAVPQLSSAKTHRRRGRGWQQLEESGRVPVSGVTTRVGREDDGSWQSPGSSDSFLSPSPFCIHLIASHRDHHHCLHPSLPSKVITGLPGTKHNSLTQFLPSFVSPWRLTWMATTFVEFSLSLASRPVLSSLSLCLLSLPSWQLFTGPYCK